MNTRMIRIIILVLLTVPMLAMASPTRKQVDHAVDPSFHRSDAPWISLAVAEAADIYTTEQSFHRGCIEGNPVYGQHPRLATLIGAHVLTLALAWPVRKEWPLYIATGFFTATSIHNATIRCSH